MNFNTRVAKIGKGKYINGYRNEGGEICLYLNNKGITKKHLFDTDNGYKLETKELTSECSEIIKLSENLFVKRSHSQIKVVSSDE